MEWYKKLKRTYNISIDTNKNSHWSNCLKLENISDKRALEGYQHLKAGGKLENAKNSFKLCLSKNPLEHTALYGLALVYRGLGDTFNSLKCFHKLLKMNLPDQYFSDQLFLTISRIPDIFAFTQKYSADHDDLYELYCVTGHALSYNMIASVWNLENDKIVEAKQFLEQFFLIKCVGHPQYILNLELLTTTLEQRIVGKSSLPNFISYIATLSDSLSKTSLNKMDCQEINATLSLMAIIRSADVEKHIIKNNISFDVLSEQTLIRLMHVIPVTIAEYFQNGCKQSKTNSIFNQICMACFKAKDLAAVSKSFQKSQTIAPYIQALDQDEQIEIYNRFVNVHFLYNSTGNLALGQKLGQILTEVHNVIYDTHDIFARGEEHHLNSDWISGFGHLFLLDIMLCAEEAGFGPKIPRKIIAPKESASNPAVFDILMENGFECISPTQNNPQPYIGQMSYIHSEEHGVIHQQDFYKIAQAKLQNMRDLNHLKLPENWIDKGNKWLETLGIKREDHLVIFHCREASYKACLLHAVQQSRNSSLESFYPSIKYLLDEQSHVIRIGDMGMSSFNECDHAQYHEFREFEDCDAYKSYYLLWRANLFLGTNSGPAAIANLFETRCLLANWFPLYFHISNIQNNTTLIPKMIKIDGELASLTTMLQDPLSMNEFPEKYTNGEALDLIDNSETEILNAVKEIIGLSPENITEDVEKLHQRTKKIWSQYVPCDMSFPTSFLKKHEKTFIA